MSEKNLERMRLLYEGVRPTTELNERVMARIQQQRDGKIVGCGAASGRDGISRRAGGGCSVTRRVVVAGAAACAVMAGLALALPAILGPSGGSFGLAIAQALGAGGAVAVTAGPDGLMPHEDHMDGYLSLRLNLSARGEGIDRVTYRIENSPHLSADYARQHGSSVAMPAVELGQGTIRTFYESYDADDPTNVAGSTHQQFSIMALDSLSVSYARRSGTSDFEPTDGVYNFVIVNSGDAIWDTDPTLRLMRAWLDLVPTPSDDAAAKREAARRAFVSAFDELAADDATFYEWLRGIYVTGFELAATRLAEAALVADVTFEDGSTTTRSYRIDLVDDHEQVLLDRFDALCELDGYAGIERAQTDYIPWVSLPIPTDEQVNADSRLSRPIFTIEDVAGR